MSTTFDIMQNLKRHQPIQSSLALTSTSTGGLRLLLFIVVVNIASRCSCQQGPNAFPGVSREVAPFCSSRPSLSIDLAPMIVHVKRNTSFNYKLYLVSSNEFVFQTGQIVPRDHFKIHSFPVKLKSLHDFLVAQEEPGGQQQHHHLKTFRYDNSSSSSLVQVANSSFDWRSFLRLVPLVERERERELDQTSSKTRRKQNQSKRPVTADDLHGNVLPGDHQSTDQVASPPPPPPAVAGNLNELIQFDRDDQLEPLGSRRKHRQQVGEQADRQQTTTTTTTTTTTQEKLILPVASFSSFHVNLTYLVRKDFGQSQPELVKLLVDAAKFQVSEIHLISSSSTSGNSHNATSRSYPSNEDYSFLSHRLLRDLNTRITSISQIYEDWITRNFYTIVYIQRRLDQPDEEEEEEEEEEAQEERPPPEPSEHLETSSEERKQVAASVSDRLIFRGSSPVLLGAEQLDYDVKASAFITEKNGLHYYLEFLTNGKFYVGAVDWTKRPFKIIDSRKFPMKQTKTMYDNEELLLCPPALCYSEQPIDELVGYGRLALQDDHLDNHHLDNHHHHHHKGNRPSIAPDEDLQLGSSLAAREPRGAAVGGNRTALIELVRVANAASLEVRLHLRDWTWTLTRSPNDKTTSKAAGKEHNSKDGHQHERHSRPAFVYHFEWAKRNDVKVSPDSYGFALAGHQIDASYRVFNELYLISDNHLITINYTLSNETVTSSQLIGDEFAGLSSTLSDPITGALYDRHSNELYFFKGDRYVGYDFATKRPLEEFQLAPAQVDQAASNGRLALVSSLPVIGILGRQHQVDGVYHDLLTDVVYVFSGMKFYSHLASQFKDGAFRAAKQPAWQCINQHFLEGCHFDEAYPNPCKLDEHPSDRQQPPSPSKPKSGRLSLRPEANSTDNNNHLQGDQNNNQNNINNNNNNRLNHLTSDFSQEQQLKLMSIAARGGLLDFLSQGPLRQSRLLLADSPAGGGSGAGRPSNGSSAPAAALDSSQERIVVYLLMAMVAITIVVTAAMIVVLLNWTKRRHQPTRLGSSPLDGPPVDLNPQADLVAAIGPSEFRAPFGGQPPPPPPMLLGHNNYLANQHHFMRRQHQQQQQQMPGHQSYLVGGQRQLVGDPLGGPAPPIPAAKPPKFFSTPANSTSTSRRPKRRDKIDSSAL